MTERKGRDGVFVNHETGIGECGGNLGPFRIRRFGEGKILGRNNKLLQTASRSRSHRGVIADRRVHPLLVVVGLDVFEHVPLRLLPRLAVLAIRQLALERLEEGFRERVVPWVGRDMDWAIP